MSFNCREFVVGENDIKYLFVYSIDGIIIPGLSRYLIKLIKDGTVQISTPLVLSFLF